MPELTGKTKCLVPIRWLNMNLSVNGGTDKAKYKISFIHQDQPSVMVGNS